MTGNHTQTIRLTVPISIPGITGAPNTGVITLETRHVDITTLAQHHRGEQHFMPTTTSIEIDIDLPLKYDDEHLIIATLAEGVQLYLDADVIRWDGNTSTLIAIPNKLTVEPGSPPIPDGSGASVLHRLGLNAPSPPHSALSRCP